MPPIHQIRQASRANAAVTLRLLETIAVVARVAENPYLQAALLRHARLIHHGSQEAIPASYDRAEVDDRYRAVLRALDAESAVETDGSLS